MALVLKDRVREVSYSTGTGSITLAGAYTGYQTFSNCIPNGSVVYYCITNSQAGYESQWEVGYGTYTLSTNTLSRSAPNVYDSSSGPSTLVSFSSPSTLTVFITQPAEQAIYQETNGNLKLVGGVIGLTQDGTEGTTLPNTSFQAFTTGDYYMQANQQNLDSGASASADWVVTADNGSDTTNYIDMGMASSGYNYPDFGAQDPNSGYVISTGANLQLVAGKYGANVAGANASATDIVFVAGDLLKSGVRGFIKGSTGNWILGPNGTSDTGEKLQVTGTSKFTGNASFGSFVYSAANTAAGNSTTLATKAYVDTYASGINIHASCVYATTVDLGSVTYNNGTDGVGATLTNAGTQAALQIDGHTFTGTDVSNAVRVLVKNESNAAYNGIYTVTNQGSGSTNWVLTRATDYDTGGTGEGAISVGDYTFITSGSTNAYTSWVQTTTGTVTVGTTNLVFAQFSQATQYTGTAPINVSGQTIALTGVVDVAHGGTNVASYTSGDLLYASGATTLSKRAIGSTGNVLIVSGGLPSWGTVDLSSSNAVTSTLTQDHGGTGFNTYTLGDLIYSNATNTLAKLPGQTTTTKKYLSQTGDGVNSAAPTWAQVAAADISGLAPSATTDTSNATNITSGTLPTGRLTGSYTGVTGVGTLTAGTWNANTIAVGYGGTGVATLTGLAYGNGTSAFTAASAAQVVAVIGSTAVANATYAVSANSATYSSNLIGGLAGSIPYQSAANTTVLLASGSGVLVGGATPTWSTAPTLTGTNFSSIPNSATTASAANGASTIVARDINGSFAANVVTATSIGGNGSGLTNLNASNLSSGTIGSSILGNSSLYVGTTAIALNRTTGAQTLTGVSIDGNAGTATSVAAANLTGSTLASGVTGSSLTSVGTIGTGTWNALFTAGLSGANLASLNASNLSSGTIGSGILGNSTVYVGTTAIPLNRASLAQSLTGVSIDGSAGTITNATQANLTTATNLVSVGNITSGTWSASTIAANKGGTGVAGTLTGVAYMNGASAYTAATAAQVVAVIGSTAVANATYATSAGSATTATTATQVSNAHTAGTGLSGTTYNGSAAVTWNLATSGVVAGTYSTANITVDTYGRITAASSGSGGGFGTGQTWQDVTGSRSSGTTYTNTTGKPIAVAIIFAWPSRNDNTVYVSGVKVWQFGIENNYAQVTPAFTVVPNGATYQANGNAGFQAWVELR